MSKRIVIETFDDFEEEMTQFFPDPDNITFNVTNPLQRHFFEVADKHGILDQLIDDDYDRGEP